MVVNFSWEKTRVGDRYRKILDSTVARSSRSQMGANPLWVSLLAVIDVKTHLSNTLFFSDSLVEIFYTLHLVNFRLTALSRLDVKNQSTGCPMELNTTVSGIGQNENGQRSLHTKSEINGNVTSCN